MKFLPKHFSSAHHSLFQAAVREAGLGVDSIERGLHRHSKHQQAAATVLSDQNPPAKGTLEVCASLTLKLIEAHLKGDQQEIESLEDQLKFSPCDAAGWLKAVAIYLKYYADGALPTYRTYQPQNLETAFVYPLPEAPVTVGVIGDWGTGEQVADVVLEQVFKHKPDLLIHVGDIYYAGTPDEAQQNFLDVIEAARAKASSRQIPIYNLPGNHDYYSGGQGFFNTLDQLNSPPQEASFFCLRNSHWQLQGMDTGYYDHDLFKVSEDTTHLHDSEIAWHQDKLASAGKRKVILFSHHQPFSSFLAINKGTENPGLLAAFQSGLRSEQIVAWLWGHEHLMEVYGPHLGLKAGRCIGNGAFPELVSSGGYQALDESKVGPLPPLLEDPSTGTFYQTGISEDVFNHGYAILKLGDQVGYASYFQVPGDGIEQNSSLLFEETLA